MYIVRGATVTNSHRYTVTVSPSPASPVFTVRRHRFHRSSPFASPVFIVRRHRFHRSSPTAINSEHLTIRGEKLPLRYQLLGNGVTEVLAIRFLTKDFQYSFFEGFRSRGNRICYRFLEITDLIFSVRKGYFNKITNFYKV